MACPPLQSRLLRLHSSPSLCLSPCLCVSIYVCVCVHYVPVCRCEWSFFCFVGYPKTSRIGQTNPRNSDSGSAAATNNKRQECPPQEQELSSSSLSLKVYYTACLAMMMHGAKDDDDDATYDPSKCPAMKQGIRAQNQVLHGPDLPPASSRRESPKTKTKKKRRRRSLTPLFFAIAESSVVFSISSLQFSDTFHFLALLEFPPVMHLQLQSEVGEAVRSIERSGCSYPTCWSIASSLLLRFFSDFLIAFSLASRLLLQFSQDGVLIAKHHGPSWAWSSCHGWPTTVQMGVWIESTQAKDMLDSTHDCVQFSCKWRFGLEDQRVEQIVCKTMGGSRKMHRLCPATTTVKRWPPTTSFRARKPNSCKGARRHRQRETESSLQQFHHACNCCCWWGKCGSLWL